VLKLVVRPIQTQECGEQEHDNGMNRNECIENNELRWRNEYKARQLLKGGD
jgi:hypothetical protein